MRMNERMNLVSIELLNQSINRMNRRSTVIISFSWTIFLEWLIHSSITSNLYRAKESKMGVERKPIIFLNFFLCEVISVTALRRWNESITITVSDYFFTLVFRGWLIFVSKKVPRNPVQSRYVVYCRHDMHDLLGVTRKFFSPTVKRAASMGKEMGRHSVTISLTTRRHYYIRFIYL